MRGCYELKVWDYIVLTVVVIGAINWGLIGFFKFDLVSWLFGSMSLLTRIIYAIVGLGGLYLLSLYGRIRRLFPGIKKCVKKESGQPAPFNLYYVLFVKN